MHPHFLIHINGKGFITLYGICIGVGVILAFLLYWWLAKKGKVDQKYVDFTSIALVISTAFGFFSAGFFPAIGGAIKGHGFHFGTLSFVAGAVGGVIMFFVITLIFRNKYKGKLIDVLSIAACCLVLAHGIGRIGCFFAGCCHGAVTDSVWGVVFSDYGPLPRIPTQLFEVFFDFLLCIFMVALYLKEKFQHNFSLYMIGYGSFRFLIEHLRDEDSRMFLAPGFSATMLVCILLVVGGIVLFFIMSPLVKKREAYLAAHPIVNEPEEKISFKSLFSKKKNNKKEDNKAISSDTETTKTTENSDEKQTTQDTNKSDVVPVISESKTTDQPVSKDQIPEEPKKESSAYIEYDSVFVEPTEEIKEAQPEEEPKPEDLGIAVTETSEEETAEEPETEKTFAEPEEETVSELDENAETTESADTNTEENIETAAEESTEEAVEDNASESVQENSEETTEEKDEEPAEEISEETLVSDAENTESTAEEKTESAPVETVSVEKKPKPKTTPKKPKATAKPKEPEPAQKAPRTETYYILIEPGRNQNEE